MNEELARLNDKKENWKEWGPYLSERQWGTVREDKSNSGDAWNFVSHDLARSYAYEWGEDGIAGISDEEQVLCFAPCFWNAKDPILKERLFGLTNEEGNHGEDVKEYYYYLDSSPTHSYMKYLYKYPIQAYPYDEIVKKNKIKKRTELEFEVIDTPVLDNHNYFDIQIEYAKKTSKEIFIQITAKNLSNDKATLYIMPTLWFRKNSTTNSSCKKRSHSIHASSERGNYFLNFSKAQEVLFTDNETNPSRVPHKSNSTFFKDGFHEYFLKGKKDAVNFESGTKSCLVYQLEIDGNSFETIKLKLSPTEDSNFLEEFDSILESRKTECSKFYDTISPDSISSDDKQIFTEAISGMLWSKQFYYFDVMKWRKPDGIDRIHPRNKEWSHMINKNIISMPDKWEYPWYAAWDLAFHCIPIGIADINFAKEQLTLMLTPEYMHPNGQIPAYEWNFSDVNPPVHAWACFEIYQMEKEIHGKEDFQFLKYCYHKLLLNFTWWVNQKDSGANNIFEGGFLGLDNIGVFDRSSPLPTGGKLEQADGTAWMCFYSLEMLRISIELASHDLVYEDMACKFYEQFIYIAGVMNRIGNNNDELWDEEDGFFYDLLSFPDTRSIRLKVRSMVGLVSLFANLTISDSLLEKLPKLKARIEFLEKKRPDLMENISHLEKSNGKGRRLLGILNEKNLKRVLEKLVDKEEFFSEFGIRSLSKFHAENPFIFSVGREIYRVDYEPAESTTGLFGGNSNWRGPIWIPVNYLIIRGLLNLFLFYGDSLKLRIESKGDTNLWGVAKEISERLVNIFRKNKEGLRPVYGDHKIFNEEDFNKHIMFYEYFHGDNGAGIGASHQTGWTGVVARLIQFFGSISEQDFWERGDKSGMFYKE
ncbi:MAG: hypothetical protein SFU98_14880 [Leptospiraceae bacterium]|nr:hypothetical protein [Leptospiraceae bacterium]